MVGKKEGRKAGQIETKVLTPGRLETHWLAYVRYYVKISGPMRVQLVSGVTKGITGKLAWPKGRRQISGNHEGWKGAI